MSKAEGASFSFTKIVDTNTVLEGSNLSNANPNNLPAFLGNALDNGNVAFFSQGGIYTSINGSIKLIANINTPIPGGTGNFAALGSPSFNNGSIVFTGYGATFFPNDSYQISQEGVYTNLGGLLSVVADRNTPIPNGTGNFVFFGLSPALNGGVIAFTASGNNNSGIYKKDNNSLSVVADNNTTIPESTQKLGNFSDPIIDKGNIIFFGSTSLTYFAPAGIYTESNNSLNVILNENASIVGGLGNITFSNSFNANDGSVVINGSGPSSQGQLEQGVYLGNRGSLSLIADLNTPIPDGVGNFTNFGFSAPDINKGNVAFVGYGKNSQAGIYTTLGGSLTKVIDINDILDGKSFQRFAFSSATLGPQGLNNNQIAFLAQFNDGSQGVYVAALNPTPIPESSNIFSLLVVTALGTISISTRLIKRHSILDFRFWILDLFHR